MPIWKKILILTVLLLISATFLNALQSVSAVATEANIGGFLLPFDGRKLITQNGTEGGNSHIGRELDFADAFPILAPKDGIVLWAIGDAVSIRDQFGFADCTKAVKGANVVVIGHGGSPSEGKYQSYSYYFHLNEINVLNGDYVHVGQQIGTAGRTGRVGGTTGYHLHFEHSLNPPMLESNVTYGTCDGTVAYTRPVWVQFPGTSSVEIGFEEYANMWPIENGAASVYTKDSFNRVDIETGNCDPRTSSVIIYNHIDFGGECVVINDPSQTFNVPDWMHVSSVYLNPEWAANHFLTIYSGSDLTGDKWGVLLNSIADLREFNYWNDQIKSTHNSFTGASWLIEFSIADEPPLETNIHLVVEDQGDFDAMRICFNGENCQETAATELYYTWPTYLEEEGDYLISVQYRRNSHNQDWANAEKIEYGYHLNLHDQYTACGGNAPLELTSGSDCIGIIAEVQDLGFVGWGDRSNLIATVKTGAEQAAWLSNGVIDQYGNFTDAPRVVQPGETTNVGNDISSLKLLNTVEPIGPIPDEPLGLEPDTLFYADFENGALDLASGNIGTVKGAASFVSGVFGTGLYPSNPPDGSGIVYPAFDIDGAFTIELWFARTASCNGPSRLAGQLGGGNNIGESKWLLSMDGNRPKYEQWHNTGSLILTSYQDVPNDGSWNYIMVTYDGYTSVMMYLNNVLVGNLNTGEPIAGGATTFEIGMAEGIYSTECLIDEVRISNIVREPEIGNPPPPTPTPEPTSTATMTPANDFVVYMSSRDGIETLYKANTDGSSEVKLAGGATPWHASYPRVSPDNSKIAFEGYPGGDRFLWIMDADGSNQMQLYSGAIHHARITWAFDGSKIMFIGTDGNAYTIESDGNNLTQIFGWPIDYRPSAWCSNDRILAVYNNGVSDDIYSLNSDGSNITQLTTNPARDAHPDWSGDCSQFVFQTNRTGQYEIWKANADGSNQTQLTITPNGEWSIYPIWSADSDSILFSSSRDSVGYWDLFTMNANDGSNIVNITNTSYPEQWSDWSNSASGIPQSTATPINTVTSTPTLLPTLTVAPTQTTTQTPTPTNTSIPPTVTSTPVLPTATNTPEPSLTMHVGDLDSSSVQYGSRWDASVYITIHNANENPVVNATVNGSWSNGANGSNTCNTDSNGQCTISKNSLKNSVGDVTFTITSVTHTNYDYEVGNNHDPDGDSDGTIVVVYKDWQPGPTATPEPTVTSDPDAAIHIGDLDGSSTAGNGNRWNAIVIITVYNTSDNPVANTTVIGNWSNGTNGSDSCITNASGQCSITKNNIRNSIIATFTVDNVTLTGNTYNASANHDPDGDSNGTTIDIAQP